MSATNVFRDVFLDSTGADVFGDVFEWDAIVEPDPVFSTRLNLLGCNGKRLALRTTSNERLSMRGTSGKRLAQMGASR
jgi:hypothetical protein